MSNSYWSSNKIIAILLFFFSIFYLRVAYQIPLFSLPTPVDSDLFPKVLGFSMLILCVLLYFEQEKGEEDTEEQVASEQESGVIDTQEAKASDKATDRESNRQRAQSRKQVLITMGSITLYVILFEVIGFILSTLLFIFGMTTFFGYKKYKVTILVSLILTLVLYLGLTKALNIYLPKGWLPFI